MSRQLLLEQMPRWIEIEHESDKMKMTAVVEFIDRILCQLEKYEGEPGPWELHHLCYALEALVTNRFYAALTFAELALANPDMRQPNATILGASTVKRAHLRQALQLIRSNAIGPK